MCAPPAHLPESPRTRRREISTFAADCHYSPFFISGLPPRRIPPFPEPESGPVCEGK